MWKKFLIGSSLIISTISFPRSASANSSRICTQTRGSSVSLRTGPGTNYARGLVEVGSGGDAVNNYFRQRNYTIPMEKKFLSSQVFRVQADVLGIKLGQINGLLGFVLISFVGILRKF